MKFIALFLFFLVSGKNINTPYSPKLYHRLVEVIGCCSCSLASNYDKADKITITDKERQEFLQFVNN
ncbi:MAG: hypothetical protein R2798_01095 [Chitinophagales bacterium]|nr:hypothetical protein [Bacteroidota bacterium]MCB9043001.1 hypothetical protein [Chitinophagales bacterium]